MSESVYVWAMRVTVVGCYAVGGLACLLAGRWWQGMICFLYGTANYFIFFGGK